MRRRSEYPGVRPVSDRHGVRRFRFRRTQRGKVIIDVYLPPPWGGKDFAEAYEAAIANADTEQKAPVKPRSQSGTIGHVIEGYLSSKRYADLADSTRHNKRLRLDRIRENLGKHRLDALKVHHVEQIMEKYGGPNAANRFKKELSEMYSYARRFHGYTGTNPASLAESRRVRKGGHHTWTMDEVASFRARFESGTQARLAFELLLNSGAARVDVVRLGPRDIRDGALSYRRQKTERQGEEVVEVTIPIVDHLQKELDARTKMAMTFLCHSETGKRYSAEGFGNRFREWCVEAGVPGRAHGLRKAGATMLAEAGATELEISSYLGHSTTKEAATYVKTANRALMAASGMAKLTKREQVLSNRAVGLDKMEVKKT